MDKQIRRSKEKWSSWFAFVWVAAGAAVGLGNVWKFPYMAGSNGGSAFVIMYLFFVLLIAVPVMAAEILLGKLTQMNPIDGISLLARKNNRSPAWRFIGYLGLTTLQLVFCFYSVVAGWSLAYLYLGISDSFSFKSPTDIQVIWQDLLSNPSIMLLCSALFIFFTMVIVHSGIKKGIERACTVMMPGLLAVLLVLVINAALSGDGFYQAIDFLFSFRPENIGGTVIISSLGHAFFTLAVGACAMMVYGSYLPRNASIGKSILMVVVLDVLVAMLSGLAIFPLIFEHGLRADQGPGLMFVTLPIVFASIPHSSLWASLFFLLLFFAALSSSLSFAEPLVDALMERVGLSRRRASLVIGTTTFLGSILCALSFNVLKNVRIAGRFSVFEFIADISTNILLPMGGIAISLFAGLVIKPGDLFSRQQKYGRPVFALWRVLTLVIAPISILIVLLHGLSEFVSL